MPRLYFALIKLYSELNISCPSYKDYSCSTNILNFDFYHILLHDAFSRRGLANDRQRQTFWPFNVYQEKQVSSLSIDGF